MKCCHQKLFLTCLFTIINFSFYPDKAFSGNFNYQNILLGERAAGMGGAYIGLSDTSEGTFYNPAGLAFSKYSSFSGTANIYALTRGTKKDVFEVGFDIKDQKIKSFKSIPSTAAYLIKFGGSKNKDAAAAEEFAESESGENDNPISGRHALGLSVLIKDRLDYEGKVDFQGESSQGILIHKLFDETLWVGPSYSFRVNDKFGLGVSFFYAQRTFKETNFARLESGSTLGEGFSDLNLSAGAFEFLLGVRYSFNDLAKAGVVFRPPSINIYSSGSQYLNSSVFDLTESRDERNEVNMESLNVSLKEPMKLGLGLAVEKSKRFAVAVDANLFFPNNFWFVKLDDLQDQGGIHLKQQFVFNANIGMEYYIYSKIPLRAGFFTNFSSSPDPGSEDFANVGEKLDFYGFSVASAYEEKHYTMSAGISCALGNGYTLSSQNKNIVDFSLNTINLFLAGSYTF